MDVGRERYYFHMEFNKQKLLKSKKSIMKYLCILFSIFLFATSCQKNVSKNLNNDLKTSFINELQNNAVLQIGDVISNQYNWNNVTTFKTNGTYLGGIVNSSNGKRMILIKDGNSYHINMFKVDDFVRNNDKSISANIRIYSIDGTMIKSNIIQ